MRAVRAMAIAMLMVAGLVCADMASIPSSAATEQ